MSMTTTDITRLIMSLLDGLDPVNKFIKAAECLIYEADDIDAMDSETLHNLYNLASKRQVQILELGRKLLMQTKSLTPNADKDEELLALAAMLKGLSKTQLDQLKANMQGKLH